VPEGEAVVDQLRFLRLPLCGAALVPIIAAELGLDGVVVIVGGLGRGRLAGLLGVVVVVDQLELHRERGGEGDALRVERMSLADRQL
jgi:hypothetical protein